MWSYEEFSVEFAKFVTTMAQLNGQKHIVFIETSRNGGKAKLKYGKRVFWINLVIEEEE
jgi:hypothetical protein